MEEIMIPLSFFAAVVLIVYIFLSTRNKERMALIDKGADAKLFNTGKNYFSALKIGMFFAGIGIGILVGNIIAVSTTLEEEVAYFSMIFLFGGASLIAYHLLDKKNAVEKE
ncbi:MAG: hypothetical protein P1P88_00660 [Bacteroidales bacterium]|nr:hypothetical protein [Bacteroidales bacterium]